MIRENEQGFIKRVIRAAILSSITIPIFITYPLFIVLETYANRGLSVMIVAFLALFLVNMAIWLVSSVIFIALKRRGLDSWIHLVITVILCFLVVQRRILALYVDIANPILDPEKLTNVRYFLGLSFTVIVHLTLVMIYTRNENARIFKSNTTLTIENLEAKYKLLKEQINPHFLFNALNISKSLVKRDPDKAESYIVQLSGFLRASLENQKKANSLKDEIALGKDYLDLQSVRFGKSIKSAIDFDENYSEHLLPYFTLVTTLENAIKHNAFTTRKPLQITIKTVGEFLMIKNNVKKKTGVESTNTGLSNLNQRSVLLSGSEIEVTADEEFFEVRVKLSPDEDIDN